jgi:hypothetical protein
VTRALARVAGYALGILAVRSLERLVTAAGVDEDLADEQPEPRRSLCLCSHCTRRRAA